MKERISFESAGNEIEGLFISFSESGGRQAYGLAADLWKLAVDPTNPSGYRPLKRIASKSYPVGMDTTLPKGCYKEAEIVRSFLAARACLDLEEKFSGAPLAVFVDFEIEPIAGSGPCDVVPATSRLWERRYEVRTLVTALYLALHSQPVMCVRHEQARDTGVLLRDEYGRCRGDGTIHCAMVECGLRALRETGKSEECMNIQDVVSGTADRLLRKLVSLLQDGAMECKVGTSVVGYLILWTLFPRTEENYAFEARFVNRADTWLRMKKKYVEKNGAHNNVTPLGKAAGVGFSFFENARRGAKNPQWTLPPEVMNELVSVYVCARNMEDTEDEWRIDDFRRKE